MVMEGAGHSFPIAAITNYYKMGSLKQHNFIYFFSYRGQKSKNSIIGYTKNHQGYAPSQGSRGKLVLCLFQFLGATNIPWLVGALL